MYGNSNARPVRKIPVRVLRDQSISRSQAEQQIRIDEAVEEVPAVSDEIALPDWEREPAATALLTDFQREDSHWRS